MLELFDVAVTINKRRIVFRNIDWSSYLLLQTVANNWNGEFEELRQIFV